jgi:hypothetical protein
MATKILDRMQGDPTHPLREAENRHYMVLAAYFGERDQRFRLNVISGSD